ncbi:hypothetical protein SAMN06297387_101509 [Streptomyces zhaozhouensis]|uniref:Uncharacterized protein n=1 Tax=Streptomyces zhaozhouensis TaxID=1300267 RepID=A0A286DK81_9ACTN|nr:hypothetical protein [Streptomyces zhaozhouensis]SOD59155.1 hypothetical protein SAMN06297387_101509 [Streptomyces zhaozhouensis]
MTPLRWTLGLLGVAAMLAGARLLVAGTPPGTPLDVALWLAGAVMAHDLLLAPLVLLVGAVVWRLPERRALRGALLTIGCVALITLPILLRPGPPRNATVLRLDYPLNLLGVVAAVLLAASALVGVRRARRRGDAPNATGPGT